MFENEKNNYNNIILQEIVLMISDIEQFTFKI